MTIAYGFLTLENDLRKRVSQVGADTLSTAIQQSVAEHNRQVGAIMTQFAGLTTSPSRRFKTRANSILQPLDETGTPILRRPVGYYDTAFPILDAGTGYGNDRVTRAKATVEDLNDLTLEMLGDDATWIRYQALRPILNNVAWTFNDPEYGSLTIKPLANGDTDLYPKRNGTSATANHYYAQTASISDTDNPFPTLYRMLADYNYNGRDLVVYVASNLVADIEGLAEFKYLEDMNVNYRATDTAMDVPAAVGLGDELIGRLNRMWIVEYSLLPDNYGFGVAINSQVPTLLMRQHPEPQLQGLVTEINDVDGNLKQVNFIRMAGFGAYNRVGGFAFQIGAASYSAPTPYG